MPKKKNKNRKPTPARSRQVGVQESLPDLIKGPARTLVEWHVPDDEEMTSILAHWPFSMTSADGPGGLTSLARTAEATGSTVPETAQSLVDLENAGFLVWQAEQATYVMTTPDDAPVGVQFNKDLHECMICHEVVTGTGGDGSNQPCGHRVPTLVTKAGG